MTRCFTAEVAAVLEQGLVDIAVADLGTNETDTRLAQRPLEAEVAHQRADHRPVQATAGLPVAGQHEQQVVAVAEHPAALDDTHPVRSEERRVGKEWVSTCQYRMAPAP